MSTINKNSDRDVGSKLTQKLMVHGFVCPENSCTLSIEVRRGMTILSNESLEVGQVAAVILDRDSLKATHILLGRLPETRGYWMVPVDLISDIHDGIVQLSIAGNAVDNLPPW